MICANQECLKEFTPIQKSQLYCCHACGERVRDLRKLARKHERTKPHGCRRCGEPVLNKHHTLCDTCLAMPRGAGIAPLETSQLRTARKREQELIDKIVAQALAQERERDVNLYRLDSRPRLAGVRVG